jgi:hypothetical protein
VWTWVVGMPTCMGSSVAAAAARKKVALAERKRESFMVNLEVWRRGYGL